jgi:hypothetical protein
MTLLHDLRFGFRQLRKSPGFTLTALVTLGLCIGANTAIYSVVDAVLLRPLPYPEADRLAMVVTAWHSNGAEGINTSQTGTQFERVRDGDPDLDVACNGGESGVNFAAGGHAEYVRQERVSTGFFRVLGVAPRMGREFSPAEDKSGGAPVTVLSYNFWQRVFHGDPRSPGAYHQPARRALHRRRHHARGLPDHNAGRFMDTVASLHNGRGRRIELRRGRAR